MTWKEASQKSNYLGWGILLLGRWEYNTYTAKGRGPGNATTAVLLLGTSSWKPSVPLSTGGDMQGRLLGGSSGSEFGGEQAVLLQ